MDASWKTLAVFDAQHECEEGEVVETGEARVEGCFERDYGHSSEGEGEVEDYHCRQEEEEECE